MNAEAGVEKAFVFLSFSPPAPKPCSGFMSPNSRRNAVWLCEPAEGERTVGSAWGRGAGTFPGLRVSWRCEPDVAAAGFRWRAVTTPASTPHTHTHTRPKLHTGLKVSSNRHAHRHAHTRSALINRHTGVWKPLSS